MIRSFLSLSLLILYKQQKMWHNVNEGRHNRLCFDIYIKLTEGQNTSFQRMNLNQALDNTLAGNRTEMIIVRIQSSINQVEAQYRPCTVLIYHYTCKHASHTLTNTSEEVCTMPKIISVDSSVDTCS